MDTPLSEADYNAITDRVYIEGWTLALTFGAVDQGLQHSWWPAAVCAALSAFCQFVFIRWAAWIKARPNNVVLMSVNKIATDARWWVITGMVFIGYLALSPYIEQHRWPFQDWFTTSPKAATGSTDVSASLAAARDAAIKQRDEARAELDAVKRTSAAMTPGALATEGLEIGAITVLLIHGKVEQILSQSANIKTASIVVNNYDIVSTTNTSCVTAPCSTIRVFFNSSYGPFKTTATDVFGSPNLNLGVPPTASISRASDDALDIVINPGLNVFQSELRELRLSIGRSVD